MTKDLHTITQHSDMCRDVWALSHCNASVSEITLPFSRLLDNFQSNAASSSLCYRYLLIELNLDSIQHIFAEFLTRVFVQSLQFNTIHYSRPSDTDDLSGKSTA